jgi:hypothetical protein
MPNDLPEDLARPHGVASMRANIIVATALIALTLGGLACYLLSLP